MKSPFGSHTFPSSISLFLLSSMLLQISLTEFLLTTGFDDPPAFALLMTRLDAVYFFSIFSLF